MRASYTKPYFLFLIFPLEPLEEEGGLDLVDVERIPFDFIVPVEPPLMAIPFGLFIVLLEVLFCSCLFVIMERPYLVPYLEG